MSTEPIHLGTTDAAVIATRRLLLRCLKTNDADPPGVKATYYNVRAVERMLPLDASWQTTLKDLYYRPEGLSEPAAGPLVTTTG